MDLDPESKTSFAPGSARQIIGYFEDEVARLIAISKALVGTRRHRSTLEVGLLAIEGKEGPKSVELPHAKDTIDEHNFEKHPDSSMIL
jgi:hypothetical protein